MYTVEIGRAFLELYNQKMGANLSARAFFDEVMWPVFFNSEDSKHLMQVTNSDFFQNYTKQAEEKGIPLPIYRRSILHEKISIIDSNHQGKRIDPDAYQLINVKKTYTLSGAIAVGYWAGERGGQVSDLKQDPNSEEIYCSWIGAGLSLGFGGGFDFLIEDPVILWHTYLGWPYYRMLIEETPELKGRQIEGWNGIWFTYGQIGNENAAASWASVSRKLSECIKDGTPKMLERPDWPQQLFSLSACQALKSTDQFVAQGFSMGDTNKTLGFVPIMLPEVRTLGDMWEYLLGLNNELYSDQAAMQIEKHLKLEYSLTQAVQTGGLGLRALAPKDVALIMGQSSKTDKNTLEQLEKIAAKNKNLYLYQLTWILSMAQITLPNNEELLEIAELFSKELESYSNRGTDKDSTASEKENNIKALFDATHKAAFIRALAVIIGDRRDEPAEIYNRIKQMVTVLPMDHYRLFVAVLRCSYVYCKSGGKLTVQA